MSRLRKHLEVFPPAIVRAFAKMPGENIAMTAVDISLRSGGKLSIERIRQLSSMSSWDAVPVGEMISFCEACNVIIWDCRHRNRIQSYMKIGGRGHKMTMSHLDRGGVRAEVEECLHVAGGGKV